MDRRANPSGFAWVGLRAAATKRVFYHLRYGVKGEGRHHVINTRYRIKRELRENEWARIQSIFLTRRFLPGELLTDLWGYGRTNVGRISNDEFRYLLKYVTKSGELPDWIEPRSRVRVFQSSRGFLLPIERAASECEASTPVRKKARTVSTLGQRMERWRKQALLQHGEHFEQIPLRAPFVVRVRPGAS